MQQTKTFQVDLSIYGGPLDLLLHLVKRQELSASELSLSRVTSQYLDFLEILESIDIDSTGDFLEPVGMLLEIKAREVLPSSIQEEATEETIEESSEGLIERLLEYRRYRDLAGLLEARGQNWRQRYSRQNPIVTERKVETPQRPIANIEVWDLVSAFGRILRERMPVDASQVYYDETPIHTYMGQIHKLIRTRKRIELQSLFAYGSHKSILVGMFLAALELTRHHGVLATQNSLDGPVWLNAGEHFKNELVIAEVDNVRHEQVSQSNLPMRPR